MPLTSGTTATSLLLSIKANHFWFRHCHPLRNMSCEPPDAVRELNSIVPSAAITRTVAASVPVHCTWVKIKLAISGPDKFISSRLSKAFPRH